MLEQVKIAVIGKTSSWGPAPQNNGSQKEAARMCHQKNGIRRE